MPFSSFVATLMMSLIRVSHFEPCRPTPVALDAQRGSMIRNETKIRIDCSGTQIKRRSFSDTPCTVVQTGTSLLVSFVGFAICDSFSGYAFRKYLPKVFEANWHQRGQ